MTACVTLHYMETKPRSLRLSDEVADAINALPGMTADDKLRGLLLAGPVGDSPALLEILEHVRTMAGTLPTADDLEQIIDSTMRKIIDERAAARQPATNFDPRTIPGVQVGAQNLQPRRESATERMTRERREKEERTAALDGSGAGREDIDRADEFVSS